MEDYPLDHQDYRINEFDPVDFEMTLLEPRPFRPFKSSEEYLYAMREDLAEWLNGLYEGLRLTADNFLEQMETGVVLCKHANNVVRKAREYYKSSGAHADIPIPDRDIVYRTDVQPETFLARDNVSNFISWCRALSIKECLLFETDDLVLRKNERSFILCLLEVARRGAQFGMPAPLLVQFEQEIDAELANDDGYMTDMHPVPQVVTNDLRSLHERVVELLSRCTCPSQFPMIRVADGKYRIGDTKILIFVRILRSHVMVRVGGGWDTLEHYLDKHDPCRCRSGHRLATSAKLTMQQTKSNIPSMHVTYNRPPQAFPSTPTSSPLYPRRNHQAYSNSGGHNHSVSEAQGSDDSSNSSLHNGRRPSNHHHHNGKPQQRRKRNSAGSSSEDVTDDELTERQPTEMVVALPRSPAVSRKRDSQKGTSPSSWRYAPAGNNDRKHIEAYSPQLMQNPRKNGHGPRSSPPSISTRLPSLSNRKHNQSPPRVVKVSSRVHYYPSSSWSEHRSQSTEDLFQKDLNSNLQDPSLIFHSRGASPVSSKGRRTAPHDSYNDSFRRNDPIRHSSYHSPRTYNKKSPPKPPPRPALRQDFRKNFQVSPDGLLPSKPTHPELSSPVLKKLVASNLCSDEHFMRRIEMLIAEYECQPHPFDRNGPRSLPVDLQDKMEFGSHPRRSPKDFDGRSPSKIPVPKRQ